MIAVIGECFEQRRFFREQYVLDSAEIMAP